MSNDRFEITLLCKEGKGREYEALQGPGHKPLPQKGCNLGSLFKRVRCKIFICVLYHSVIEYDFYKKRKFKKKMWALLDNISIFQLVLENKLFKK